MDRSGGAERAVERKGYSGNGLRHFGSVSNDRLQKETISVAVAADEAYAPGLCVVVYSLLEQLRAGVGLDLYVLSDSITPQTRKHLEACWGNRLRPVWLFPDNSRVAPVVPRYGYAATAPTYYSLIVGSILPAHVTRVILLDADLLILRDLHELWQHDMNGNVLLAVHDAGTQAMPAGYCGYRQNEARGHRPYFNAGVMLIDLTAWRTERVEQRSLETAEKHKLRFRYYDQDALNVCLVGRWGSLSPVWNKQFALNLFPDWQCSPYTEEEFDQARRNPAIIHFCSATKPWRQICDHPKADTEAFRRVLSRTGWVEDPFQEPTALQEISEFFARRRRRLLYMLSTAARAKQKGHAVIAYFPGILKMVLRSPWTPFTIPLFLVKEKLTIWRLTWRAKRSL